jgi:hypothetical protein
VVENITSENIKLLSLYLGKQKQNRSEVNVDGIFFHFGQVLGRHWSWLISAFCSEVYLVQNCLKRDI